VIGSQGQTVKQIRQESGACVSVLGKKVAGDPSAEKIMLIRGTIAEIASGLEMVVKALNRNSKLEEDGPMRMRLLVPSAQCGAIIGKGGETIKAMNRESGASIKITKEQLGTSTDQGVDMMGSPVSLREATIKILTELSAHPIKGQAQVPYRPGMQSDTPFEFQAHSAYGMYSTPSNPYSIGLGNGSGVGQLRLGSLAQQVRRADDNAEKVEQKISIPAQCSGMLIGKGGTTIQTLSKISRASIIILPQEEGNPRERIVSLKGTVDAIEKAIQNIKQVIESHQK